jgi:alkylation response protein AidB-like acyl-CoA dehydrogenase
MINLVPTDEQKALAEAVADFLAREAPLSRFFPSPTLDPNTDGALWPQMAELGFFGLGLSEDAGGVGYGLMEEILAFREFGRAAVSSNVLATVIGAHAAAAAGETQLAQGLIAGTVRASLANPLNPGEGAGAAHHLIDAEAADWVVVWSPDGAGLIPLAEVEEVAAVPSFDPTLPLARARIASNRPKVWAGGGEISRRASALTCAYLVGLAEAARDDSVSFTKVRTQFGQPLGAFQSVKHRSADMATRVEASWCQTLLAGLTEAAGQDDALFQLSAARMVAGDAALKNASANIQNHGAVGFTAELEAHILLKRAHVMTQIGGDQLTHQIRLMTQAAPA